MVWKSNLYGVVAPTVDWSQDERALTSGVISNSSAGASASSSSVTAGSSSSSVGGGGGGGVIGRNMQKSPLLTSRRYDDGSFCERNR